MWLIETLLKDIKIFQVDFYNDNRGYFSEIYQKSRYEKLGVKDNFVQENHSRSHKNVLRGLHFQFKKPQSQLITIIRGKVFYAFVDVRPNSLNFKKSSTFVLEENKINQVYTPPGYAGGFLVLSDFADVHYKVSQNYDNLDEGGICWNDSDLKIKWPTLNPILNERDVCLPCISEIKFSDLPIVNS